MSTDVEKEEGTEAATRKQMTLSERIAVIDYLRALRAPLTPASKTDAAKAISEACQVEMTWSQLKYMIDELPEMKLAEKFIFGDEAERGLLVRVAELERLLAAQGRLIDAMVSRSAAVESA